MTDQLIKATGLWRKTSGKTGRDQLSTPCEPVHSQL
jgi:hypothetical protein